MRLLITVGDGRMFELRNYARCPDTELAFLNEVGKETGNVFLQVAPVKVVPGYPLVVGKEDGSVESLGVVKSVVYRA